MTLPTFPLNPKAELLKWGPTPAWPLLRYSISIQGLFIEFPKLFPGYAWSKALILTDTTRFIWMHELHELYSGGARLFLDKMLPIGEREKARTGWERIHSELANYEEEINSLDLASISDTELIERWNHFHRLLELFWAHSSLPELSNYGSATILEKKLQEYLPNSDISSAMEVLTAPEGLSFYQEEEIDLAETNDLAAHQRRYFWLKNSYGNIEVLPVEFFAERKKTAPFTVKEESLGRVRKVHADKDALQTKYHLPQEVRDMGDAIAEGMHWQDVRKRDIWIYLHYEMILLNEIARRCKTPVDILLYGTYQEIADVMRGEKSAEVFLSRQKGTGIVVEGDTVNLLDVETSKRLWGVYVDVAVDESQKEFKGIVASKGKGSVQGKVRIVLDPRNVSSFENGNVLVTTMTTPEFIFVMKKAVAIITDTGGLTSHAAIVSRELGVPCLVGTKVATHVLKDGDIVEVDADNGVVRILQTDRKTHSGARKDNT